MARRWIASQPSRVTALPRTRPPGLPRAAPSTTTDALDPRKRTIVLCASGARASLAALTLKTMGYEDVAILDGGLKAWTEAGLPTNKHEYSGI
ncbi:MAG: rhodanese-like domain-containing protein [Blastococcus sp.]